MAKTGKPPGQDDRYASHVPVTRRTFMKAVAAGAAAGAAWNPGAAGGPRKTAGKLEELPQGIKVTLQLPSNPGDQDFRFAQQLGVEYVNIPSGGGEATLENFLRWKR